MTVQQIRELSPTIKNFILKPSEGEYVDYLPGQFLTFHTGENQDIPRCYSLSSSPSQPLMYEVSVKRIKDGKGSTWMHNNVSVGDTLKVTQPSGRLNLKQEAGSSIFVAGGIGITPMISMLKYCVDTGDTRPLYFFMPQKTLEELVLYDEILSLASRAPNVVFVPILSNPPKEWNGTTGRLNEEMMLAAGIRFEEAELYTCGPNPLMDSVKEIALKNGMPKERFYHEAFSSPASEKMERRQCQVQLSSTNKTLVYDHDIPLLDFLEQNNIDMTSSCRAGVCGTCEITIEAGEVEQLPSDFLSDEDLKMGRRLSCICYPKSAQLKLDL